MDDDLRIRSHRITVPRTARYATLGADASAVGEVWLACHGYGQLASRFIRRFGVIDNGRRLIVAPEALSRFYVSGGTGPHSAEDKVGASWMTREERDAEMSDQVTYLDLVLERVLGGARKAEPTVVGFGFSQGAATICRWAARTQNPPRHLILWGSGVPDDLLAGEARAGIARAEVTIAVGASDPIAAGARVDLHRARLDEAGLSYRVVEYDGGHEVDASVLSEIAAGIGAAQDDRVSLGG